MWNSGAEEMPGLQGCYSSPRQQRQEELHFEK
jgi:hypothetical protein